MIIRARPKYLLEEDFSSLDKVDNASSQQKGYYFNRGSSALKFVLDNLVSYFKKDITVCMQSLNCKTVLEAALEVQGVSVLLSDIKISDFSISLSFLEDNCDDIDVLFLLHYQGLINSEYDQIIKLCKQNEIVVIEDLAHVLEFSHDFKGDFGIYSYAFDKPLTSFSGGRVELNYNKTDFVRLFSSKYNDLDYENKRAVDKDIKTLEYFMYISNEDVFKSRLENRNFVNILVGRFSKEKIASFLGNDFFYFFFRLLFKIKNFFSNPGVNNYDVFRLSDKKIALINMQYERSLCMRSDFLNLQKEIIKKLIEKNISHEIKIDCFWNRISFIPKNSSSLSKEIQFGNFNWPTPLHTVYGGLPNVKVLDDYTNTLFVNDNIINFPCWSSKALFYLV